MAHGEQGDLVVEIDEALDDHPALAGATALLGVVPGLLHVGLAAQQALALAGGTHDRLDHAGEAQLGHRGGIVREAVGEAVRRGGQAQLLGGQAADALAVHGQLGRARGGHHGEALGLQLDQGIGGDRLDLGDDVVRLLLLDHRAQGGAVEHADHMAAMRHLHGRRVGVAVDGDHLAAQALQFDGDFLAQLARAAQEHTGRARRQRGSDHGHGMLPSEGIGFYQK
ncbi:hypothetical protein D3C78_1275060 [compost metagenome]